MPLSEEAKDLLRLKSDLSISVRIRSADLVALLEEIREGQTRYQDLVTKYAALSDKYIAALEDAPEEMEYVPY